MFNPFDVYFMGSVLGDEVRGGSEGSRLHGDCRPGEDFGFYAN